MKKLASLKLMLVILLLINFLPAGCVYTPPISPEWPSDTAEEDFYIQVGKHLKNFENLNDDLIDWLSYSVDFDRISRGIIFSKKREFIQVFLNIDEDKHHFKIPHQGILILEIDMADIANKQKIAELSERTFLEITSAYLKFIDKKIKDDDINHLSPEKLLTWLVFKAYAIETVHSDFSVDYFYKKNFIYSVPERINKECLAIKLIYWTSEGVITKRFKIRVSENFSLSSSKADELAIEAMRAAFSFYDFISKIINTDIKKKILSSPPGMYINPNGVNR